MRRIGLFWRKTKKGARKNGAGRSVYGHVNTKFSWMGSLRHFHPWCSAARASRARAPLWRLSSFALPPLPPHTNVDAAPPSNGPSRQIMNYEMVM